MTTTAFEKIFFTTFMAVAIGWRAWETFRKQGSERGQTSMMWSFYALFATSAVIFCGTALEFFLAPRTYRLTVGVTGLVVFVVANVLRVVAIRTLGRYWSLHIEMREGHEFVRTGVYSRIRHPAYLSFVLEHIAVPLVGNAWWALMVTLFVYVPLLRWRIRREDAALIAKFGEPYRVYRQQVGAIWPRWGATRTDA